MCLISVFVSGLACVSHLTSILWHGSSAEDTIEQTARAASTEARYAAFVNCVTAKHNPYGLKILRSPCSSQYCHYLPPMPNGSAATSSAGPYATRSRLMRARTAPHLGASKKSFAGTLIFAWPFTSRSTRLALGQDRSRRMLSVKA